MIHCASLAYFKEGKILLVRVRDNKLWYFPGGKIAEGENPVDALVRELSEELNVVIDPKKLRQLTKITAPNHDKSDIVHLCIYTLSQLPTCRPGHEVSEIMWFEVSDTELMAPAVIEALRKIHNGS